MKSVNVLDILIIFTYFFIIMGIGLYFMKVNKGGKEYFTGGGVWGDMAMDVVQGTILLDPLTLVKGEILLYFSSITNKTAFY